MMRVSHIGVAVAILAATPTAVLAQTVGIHAPTSARGRRVVDTALVNALNNFELLGEAAPVKGTDLAVRVLAVAGESGSAKDDESDRVVHWLYIAVSEFGELPTQRLFRFGPFFEPKLDSLVARSAVPVAYVSYGLRDRRQRARIVATVDSSRIAIASTLPRRQN
jgi:hypothetical protein